MCVAIFTMILVFAVRYRRRPGVEAEQIEGSTALEITWSVIPLFIFLVIFAWGAVIYFQERTPPQGATEVYVVAKQWMWKLQHEEGQREINELHVPVGRDVKLIMTSQDVIHSFYVPAFRIKQDVLPGRYTTAWFHATKPGTYHLFCAEYCGTAALRHDRPSGGDGAGAVSGLAERRRRLRIPGVDRAELFSSSSAAPPATAPTRRAAGPTWSGCSASRCCWKTAAPSSPMKTTFANRFLTPARESGERIQTHHAGLSGAGERRTAECAGGLRKIVEPESLGSGGGPAVVPPGAKPQEPKVQ